MRNCHKLSAERNKCLILSAIQTLKVLPQSVARPYTFGTDEITQTTITYDSSGLPSPASSLTFGHDAHGSVRVLFDAVGALSQAFTYAAYGELLAIHNGIAQAVGTGGAPGLEGQALTNLLYSGESFDSRIGQQYLRARRYQTDVGRFGRLDAFSGNFNEPLSFNRYLYTHSNSVAGTDPSGDNLLGGLVGAIGMFSTLSSGYAGAGLAVDAGLTATNGVFNLVHKANKAIALGVGGYDATARLIELRKELLATWYGDGTRSPLSRASKQAIANALNNPVTGWDIGEMVFGRKAEWAMPGIASLNLTNTLTFREKVYPVSEVNYIWWGMLNRLLYEDGITKSNKSMTLGLVSVYRVLLGGFVGFRGTYTDPYETIDGKITWTDFGWEWISNEGYQVDGGDLPNAVANSTPTPFRLIGRVGPAGSVLRVDTSGKFLNYL